MSKSSSSQKKLTSDQLKVLLQFMESNTSVALSYDSPNINQQEWLEATVLVNSVPNGTVKDVEGVRMAWKEAVANASVAMRTYLSGLTKTISQTYRSIYRLATANIGDIPHNANKISPRKKFKFGQSRKSSDTLLVDLTAPSTSSTYRKRSLPVQNQVQPVGSAATQRAVDYNYTFASTSATPLTSSRSRSSFSPLQNQVTVDAASTQRNFDMNSTVSSTTGKGDDFLKNFNNIGADHVDRISAKLSELSQDMQLRFKECFDGLTKTMMETLPMIISQQLVEAVINLQAGLENKFDDQEQVKCEKYEPTANNSREEENVQDDHHEEIEEKDDYVIDEQEYDYQFLNDDVDELNGERFLNDD